VRDQVDPGAILRLEELGKLKEREKNRDFKGNGTRDFPACSIVPQPSTLPSVISKLLRCIDNETDIAVIFSFVPTVRLRGNKKKGKDIRVTGHGGP
jgi:hypothetical protein